MPEIKPFRGIRPKVGKEKEVSCLPYDVMNTKEAKKMAKGKPNSFLHVIRSEIDLPESVDEHDKKVYQKAKENFEDMIAKGVLVKEDKEVFYIYREIMNSRSQVGICCCASIDDYENNIIKKHEFTRPQKEQDRIDNFLACNAHTEPVFFAYKNNEALKKLLNEWIDNNKPVYDFTSSDDISHTLWVVDDDNVIEKIVDIFSKMDALYIADGHHRSASSYRVGKKLREQTGDTKAEFNYILAVAFAKDELAIMDYNRVVKDLNGLTKEEFLKKAEEKFAVNLIGDLKEYRPTQKHHFSMYLDGNWYSLWAKEGTFDDKDAVKSLDAYILQENLLSPVLNIEDPRTSERIEFVGGIRGIEFLKQKVDNKEGAVAFAVYPVSMDDLFKVADSGEVMPPKSTWFEPKLRSGLFIHSFK